MKRGDGQTTAQILNAPRDAIFVWCNGRTDYAKSLARFLNRTDLKIVPFEYGAVHAAVIGTRRQIVVDHSVYYYAVSQSQIDKVRHIEELRHIAERMVYHIKGDRNE